VLQACALDKGTICSNTKSGVYLFFFIASLSSQNSHICQALSRKNSVGGAVSEMVVVEAKEWRSILLLLFLKSMRIHIHH